jgi:tRNA 2-thiouridine synthesizing protein A
VSTAKYDRRLDLSGVTCPLTFAKTTVALSEMEPGQVLEVLLDPGEPSETVPRSLRLNGHVIIHELTLDSGALRLRVQA